MNSVDTAIQAVERAVLIPARAISSGLSGNDWSVLVAIAGCCNAAHLSGPLSYAQIAELAAIPKRTVWRHIGRLQAADLLRIVREGDSRHRANAYEVIG